MLKNATALVSLAAALLVGALVHAPSAAAGVPHAVVVRYGDLDLARSADAARLYARIVTAAKVVCAPEDNRLLLQVAGTRACVRETVDATVAHVGLPQLTAYHRVKSALHG